MIMFSWLRTLDFQIQALDPNPENVCSFWALQTEYTCAFSRPLPFSTFELFRSGTLNSLPRKIGEPRVNVFLVPDIILISQKGACAN